MTVHVEMPRLPILSIFFSENLPPFIGTSSIIAYNRHRFASLRWSIGNEPSLLLFSFESVGRELSRKCHAFFAQLRCSNHSERLPSIVAHRGGLHRQAEDPLRWRLRLHASAIL
jgi:hypothetical protein